MITIMTVTITDLTTEGKDFAQTAIHYCAPSSCACTGGGTVWAMWASGPLTFATVWAWPTHFLRLCFCVFFRRKKNVSESPPPPHQLFQPWPTHFQNRSAAPVCLSIRHGRCGTYECAVEWQKCEL